VAVIYGEKYIFLYLAELLFTFLTRSVRGVAAVLLYMYNVYQCYMRLPGVQVFIVYVLEAML
jgi:hypothetical protein